jgi:hypothetical protein
MNTKSSVMNKDPFRLPDEENGEKRYKCDQ